MPWKKRGQAPRRKAVRRLLPAAARSQSPFLKIDPDAAVVVRRLKRLRDKRVKLPQTLVEELARTAILGQQAWQEAREKDDFPSLQARCWSGRSN